MTKLNFYIILIMIFFLLGEYGMFVQRPPMGYNTWNTFAENINAELIKESADAMVNEGLLDAGYNYLVIDDCWAEKHRDRVTDKIVPDKRKFPLGINDVSDYVHSKGLKFGMYSCAGVRTCADYPGSFDHEYLDACTFAEYGCDYLKYDYCYKPDTANGEILYRKMGIALENCGREILFSACNWGKDGVHDWARSTGASMYRSTGDIFDNFTSFTGIALSQIPKLGASAPGCFNDIDMLTVGMFGKGHVGTTGCDYNDYVTQFSLWCLLGAPLMLGCDIRSMTPEIKALVTNKELIKIDQDIECRPPYEVRSLGWQNYQGTHVFFRHLSGGEYALGMFNFEDKECPVGAYTYDIGLDPRSGLGLALTDVMTGEELEPEKDYISDSIKAHGCRIFRGRFVKI